MNSFLLPLLMGGFGGGGGAEGGSSWMSFLPLVLIIGIFYFLILRPQNKKQKETKRMLEALKKGDRVVTIGGIHGVIQTVKESTVIVRVDESTKLEFSRSAISSISASGREEKEEKEDKKADEKKHEAPEDKSGESSESDNE